MRLVSIGILVIVILLMPLTTAEIDLTFTKNSSVFDQEETLISTISGDFIDQVTFDNVRFYKDHVRVPMDFEVSKLENDFYVYALLSNKPEGNYSMRIEDVRYQKASETLGEDLILNFTISNSTADFYVTPGFAFLENQEDFSFEIKNLKDSALEVSISSTLSSSKNQETLSVGETKTINLNLDSAAKNTLGRVFLSSENTEYSIPVLIESSSPSSAEGLAFRAEPQKVKVSLATDSSTERTLYILNYGSETAEGVTFSIPDSLKSYLEISPEKISGLGSGEAKQIKLSITSPREASSAEGRVSIFSESGKFKSSLYVSLEFVTDYVPQTKDDTEADSEGVITTCAQLGGTLCSQDEVCSGGTTPTKDPKVCCLSPGLCETPSGPSTNWKIIGWAIIVAVIALLFWFFKKYKRVRPKVDLLKIGEGKK